jgi:hypothetical protein
VGRKGLLGKDLKDLKDEDMPRLYAGNMVSLLQESGFHGKLTHHRKCKRKLRHNRNLLGS